MVDPRRERTGPPLYEGMDPPLSIVAISFVLFFLLESISLSHISPTVSNTKKTQGTLYQESRKWWTFHLISTSPHMDEIF